MLCISSLVQLASNSASQTWSSHLELLRSTCSSRLASRREIPPCPRVGFVRNCWFREAPRWVRRDLAGLPLPLDDGKRSARKHTAAHECRRAMWHDTFTVPPAVTRAVGAVWLGVHLVVEALLASIHRLSQWLCLVHQGRPPHAVLVQPQRRAVRHRRCARYVRVKWEGRAGESLPVLQTLGVTQRLGDVVVDLDPVPRKLGNISVSWTPLRWPRCTTTSTLQSVRRTWSFCSLGVHVRAWLVLAETVPDHLHRCLVAFLM